MPKALRIALPMMFALLAISRSATASTNPVLTISAVGMPTTSDTVTISFIDSAGKLYTAIVPYGPSSAPADIASAFGAEFTRKYVCVAVGNCTSGLGAVGAAGPNNTGTVTFQLNGSSFFGAFSLPAAGPFSFSGTNIPTINSSVSLLSSSISTHSGNAVTLTATVTPASATGSVIIADGGSTLTTLVLSAGSATFLDSHLSVGSHSLTAQYEGDSSYIGSLSTSFVETVVPDITDLSLSEGPAQMGIVISGSGFGTSASGSISITVGGQNAPPVGAWTDGSVTIQVPTSFSATTVPTSLPIVVAVTPTNSAQSFPSDAYFFQVDPPFQCSPPPPH